MTFGISSILPFLKWFKDYSSEKLRRDFIGGVTVALVLIPQSMAYAQLAGLPAYFGLYAAFLPPTIAALFGSSRQLATGPVAIVSLMTATALEPLATAGSEMFIAYAILLALLIGIFQLILGLVRLGLIVNFLSHPVVGGFTNAAALIIASSQLSKLFGVTVDKAEHHYETIINVVTAAFHYTHWPTLALAALAFAIMIVMKRVAPRLPNVLLAVLVTTVVSWAIGFEEKTTVGLDRIADVKVSEKVEQFNHAVAELESNIDQRIVYSRELDSLTAQYGEHNHAVVESGYRVGLADAQIVHLRERAAEYRGWLREQLLVGVGEGDNQRFYTEDSRPGDGTGGDACWRMKVGNTALDIDKLVLSCGGAVVGAIPEGLPAVKTPYFNLSIALNLLPMAIIISLLGFMEAISIAKAMAAKTGQKIDANQELIGQGLANILGSFTQSYAVSGSFSRSAVNIQAGAFSGVSNVISSAVVVVVLLFMTPLLYHLPQSVLAAIIMMAVVGLVNIRSFIHAWRAQWYDGAIGIVTFVSTLLFAPHLHHGILLGVALSILHYLIRNMKPAIAELSLNTDGSYRNHRRFELKKCPYVEVIRYGGSLIFSNVDYLETQVIDAVRNMPRLKHILLVGNGMNEIDASGVDALATLFERIRGQGIKLSLSGFNDNVLDVLTRTGLVARIGENNFYRSVSNAIDSIWEEAHEGVDEPKCPLRVIPYKPLAVSDEARAKWMEKLKAEGHEPPEKSDK